MESAQHEPDQFLVQSKESVKSLADEMAANNFSYTVIIGIILSLGFILFFALYMASDSNTRGKMINNIRKIMGW